MSIRIGPCLDHQIVAFPGKVLFFVPGSANCNAQKCTPKNAQAVGWWTKPSIQIGPLLDPQIVALPGEELFCCAGMNKLQIHGFRQLPRWLPKQSIEVLIYISAVLATTGGSGAGVPSKKLPCLRCRPLMGARRCEVPPHPPCF